jgi:hypothetical protein
MSIDSRMRELAKSSLHQSRKERFTDPAERKAYYRDSQLDAVYNLIQITV